MWTAAIWQQCKYKVVLNVKTCHQPHYWKFDITFVEGVGVHRSDCVNSARHFCILHTFCAPMNQNIEYLLQKYGIWHTPLVSYKPNSPIQGPTLARGHILKESDLSGWNFHWGSFPPLQRDNVIEFHCAISSPTLCPPRLADTTGSLSFFKRQLHQLQ